MAGDRSARSQRPALQVSDVGRTQEPGRPLPRPVLKWAGGKRTLTPQVSALLPERIATYYEPFIGGGAVFFALARARRFERAVLSDQNPDLIAVYRALAQDPDAVINRLEKLRHRRSEEDYYSIRASRPRTLETRAARILYLNKTGYNGLYRVNRSGEFNVPFGRYKNPNICDPELLRAAGEVLSQTTLEVQDFEVAVKAATAGDAIYFDPPYLPLNRTAFTEYHSSRFDLVEHERLAQLFSELAGRDVVSVLSNSDTPKTRELFGEFETKIVKMKRSINSKPGRRGAVNELLACNLPPSGRSPE